MNRDEALLPTTTPPPSPLPVKFERHISRRVTRVSSGNLNLSLERTSDYYEMLAVPYDISSEELQQRINSERELLDNMTHSTKAVYLEAASVLSCLRNEYDAYRCIVPILQNIMVASSTPGMGAISPQNRDQIAKAKQNLLTINRNVCTVVSHSVPIHFLRQVNSAMRLCVDLQKLAHLQDTSSPANQHLGSTNLS